jgi:hypothetical protein
MTESMPPAPMAPPPMAAAPLGRPTGATVISVIDGIVGVLALLAGLLLMVGAGVLGGVLGSAADPNAPGLGAMFAGLGIAFGIIVLLIGVLYLAIAYGVWKGRSWAWMLGVVVAVIATVFGVLGLAGGITVSNILSVALPVLVLYFFWQPEVKRWLGRPA